MNACRLCWNHRPMNLLPILYQWDAPCGKGYLMQASIVGNPRLIPIRSSRNQRWVTDDGKQEKLGPISISQGMHQVHSLIQEDGRNIPCKTVMMQVQFVYPVGCSCRVIPCKIQNFCTHEDVAVGRVCKPDRLGSILIPPLGWIVPC